MGFVKFYPAFLEFLYKEVWCVRVCVCLRISDLLIVRNESPETIHANNLIRLYLFLKTSRGSFILIFQEIRKSLLNQVFTCAMLFKS